jgi:hypothetical protein
VTAGSLIAGTAMTLVVTRVLKRRKVKMLLPNEDWLLQKTMKGSS